VTATAHSSSTVGTIVVLGFLVFIAGTVWIARRVGGAPPEQRNAPAWGGPAWLTAFWIWGLLCIGGVMLAIILATGSPFPGGGADSSTTSPSTPAQGTSSSERLIDLPTTSESSGSSSKGKAHVGGETISAAYLVTASNGPEEIGVYLPKRARLLEVVIGMEVTEAGVSGPRSMHIQFFTNSGDAPILDKQVVRDRAPIRRSLELHSASSLRIVVSDQQGSVYDQAVVAGEVKP
jgi:hypothetical protein